MQHNYSRDTGMGGPMNPTDTSITSEVIMIPVKNQTGMNPFNKVYQDPNVLLPGMMP
jgi:hypothetical protein